MNQSKCYFLLTFLMALFFTSSLIQAQDARFNVMRANYLRAGGNQDGFAWRTGLSGNLLHKDGKAILAYRSSDRVGLGTLDPLFKLHAKGDIYADGGWLRVSGAAGIYFQSYKGGFRMTDNYWIRTYGNKGFYHNTGIMRTDGTFQVGPSGNRFTVNTSGRTGVAITNPEYTFQLLHGPGTPQDGRNHGLSIKSTGGTDWTFYVAAGDGAFGLYRNRHFKGLFDEWSGNWIPASDLRMKTNIRTLKESQMDKIMQLRPTTYHFKDAQGKRMVYGLIAQEVEKIYPDIVVESNSSEEGEVYKALSYTELIPILISGVQELNESLEKAEEEKAEVQDRLQQVEEELDELKALIYRQQGEDRSGTSGTGTSIKLHQNVPNPSSNSTDISFELPQTAQSAKLLITDGSGRMLQSYDIQGRGNGKVTADISTLPGGIYNYSLVLDGKVVKTRRMVVQ